MQIISKQKKYKIGNVEYRIIEASNGNNVYIHDDRIRIGLTDYTKDTIYIHDELSLERRKTTLRHELVHAFLEEYGFHANRKVKLKEEAVCEFVAKHGDKIEEIVQDYFKD